MNQKRSQWIGIKIAIFVFQGPKVSANIKPMLVSPLPLSSPPCIASVLFLDLWRLPSPPQGCTHSVHAVQSCRKLLWFSFSLICASIRFGVWFGSIPSLRRGFWHVPWHFPWHFPCQHGIKWPCFIGSYHEVARTTLQEAWRHCGSCHLATSPCRPWGSKETGQHIAMPHLGS